MKKLFSIVSVFTMFVSIAVAQNRTVSINVAGNRIKQVVVDGTTYSINNTTTTAEQSVMINNLALGQHSLEIIRSNQYNNRTSSATTNFTLRDGYDLDININATGTIQLIETRSAGDVRTARAMNSTQFTKLYNATKAKPSSTARTTFLENEFSTTTRGLTAAQARQLIQLVNSESKRFQLAKLVYLKVSDKTNFSQVTTLLNSTANRNALNEYIASVDSDTDDSTSPAYTPMTSSKFNTIYNELLEERTTNEKLYYLSNLFSKDFNYYTSAQAKQLIQTLPSEVDRLTLAKEAYRGITDRASYYYSLSGIIYSTVNRNELRSYINNYDSNNGNTVPTSTAMSTASFNTLYNNIYYTSGTTARYNGVNNAFLATGNYFTAAQARQLIALVSDENSRLALAKVAYNTLVDKSNYTVFNDLFNYQSSRNELSNYVLNNGSTTTPVAMTTTSFNTLYNNIYYTSGNTARYNAINNAFMTSANYFSAAQGRQLIGLVTDENTRLALAKASFLRLVDRQNYTVYNDLFSYQATRNEWNTFVLNTGNTGTTYPGAAMSDAEFNTLYNNVDRSWNAASKISLLSSAFQSTTDYFTAYQVRQLLLLISAESDKLSLAKSAYDNLTDKYSYTQLFDVFSTTESKNELARYVAEIQSGGTGVSNRVAMPDEDFRTMVRSVQFTFGLGAKYSSLTDIFNKETNYFTVAQAKQLIELVSAESNRLNLSKLAWNNLTDPGNISQIYDIFQSQSSKDELASYIANNPYR